MLDLGIDATQKRGREEQKTIEENSDSKKACKRDRDILQPPQ